MSWIEAAKKRLHHNVLAIALAHKLARIAWAVLSARLDPEDMREIMGTYHHRCAEVIGKSGGFVAKYIAMACSPTSAIRKPTRMTLNAPYPLGTTNRANRL